MMSREKCPECGSQRVSSISDNEEIICQECGLVIDSSPIEKEPYINEARKDSSYGIQTKPVNGKIFKASWMETTRQKNLKEGMNRIDRLSAKLNLPEYANKEAKNIFKKAIEKNIGIGRDNKTIAYASVYTASIIHRIPKIPLEIIAYSGITKTKMLRMYKLLKAELKIKLDPIDPIDLIPRFGSRLGLQEDALSQATQIINKLKGKPIIQGRRPETIVAAVLYISAKISGYKRTQREVANVTGVIEVTIRKRSKEIEAQLRT